MKRAQKRLQGDVTKHCSNTLRLFYKQQRYAKVEPRGWLPSDSGSSWGFLTFKNLTFRPFSIFPFDWNVFFKPNGFYFTWFNVLTNTFLPFLNYLRLSQSTHVGHLYQHMVVNSTWSVSKFYSHYSEDKFKKKNYLSFHNSPDQNALVINTKDVALKTQSLCFKLAHQSVKLLKVQLLAPSVTNNITNLIKKTITAHYHLSWARKLLFYFRLRRNFRSFKANSFDYRTRRYVYWAYREFAGSHWKYTNPGYHQSFYEALRLSGTAFDKPVTANSPVYQSRGLFYLQLYSFNDLIAESQFSIYVGLTVVNVFDKIDNWRALTSVRRSLASLVFDTLIWANKSALTTPTWSKRLGIKNTNIFFKSYGRRRARRRSPSLRRLNLAERQQFLHSIRRSTAQFLTDLANNITLIFKFYIPVKPIVNQLHLPDHNGSTHYMQTTPASKNFNLLQMHPLLSKEMFNCNLLFKYVMTKSNLKHHSTSKPSLFTNDYLFNPKLLPNVQKTNLTPSSSFNYTIGRRLVKSFAVSKLLPKVAPWYLTNLVRFVEHCSGRKVAIRLEPFLANQLTFTDIAKCSIWIGRILGFQKILGPKFFLNEMLKAMTLALKAKDATFLSNWIRGMLKRLSFWKMRVFFRFIKYIMRYVFWSSFDYFQFKGMKICLKGKISVAGNARTRTLLYRIGTTSYSKFDNKVSYDFSCIGSFTGVMGFRVWLFF